MHRAMGKLVSAFCASSPHAMSQDLRYLITAVTQLNALVQKESKRYASFQHAFSVKVNRRAEERLAFSTPPVDNSRHNEIQGLQPGHPRVVLDLFVTQLNIVASSATQLVQAVTQLQQLFDSLASSVTRLTAKFVRRRLVSVDTRALYCWMCFVNHICVCMTYVRGGSRVLHGTVPIQSPIEIATQQFRFCPYILLYNQACTDTRAPLKFGNTSIHHVSKRNSIANRELNLLSGRLHYM